MRLKLTLVLTLLLVCSSLVFGQIAFDGKWTATVVRPAPNPSQNLTITLHSDAGKITGSVVGADPMDSAIEWGFIKSDLITFKVKMKVGDAMQTMVYVGKMNGNEIAFGRRPEDLKVGQLVEFTAKKAQ